MVDNSISPPVNNTGFLKAGYGSLALGYGQRPVILVVDFQRAFTDPKFPMGRSGHVDSAVTATGNLLSVARAGRVPVVACSVGWSCDAERARWKVASVYSDMNIGDEGLEIDPRIDHPTNYHFIKTAPSMFFGTPLNTYLIRNEIDTTIICGATTSGCVRATINDAFSYGYRVIVPTDCCGDQETDAHESNLRDVGRRYCDVVSLDSVISYLESLERGGNNG